MELLIILCLLFALVLFAIGAFPAVVVRFNLIAAGLVFLTLAFLIPHLHIN